MSLDNYKGGVHISSDVDPQLGVTAHCRQMLQEIFSSQGIDDNMKRFIPLSYSAFDSENQKIGGIAGWLSFGIVYIEAVWVGKDYRNKHVARALIEQVATRAKAFHCKKMLAATNSYSGSFEFWKKVGFSLYCQLPTGVGDFKIFYFEKELTHESQLKVDIRKEG